MRKPVGRPSKPGLREARACPFCAVEFECYKSAPQRYCSQPCNMNAMLARKRERVACETSRECLTCHEVKPIVDFTGKSGKRRPHCKPCVAASVTTEQKRRWHLQSKFDLTLENWLAIYDSQSGTCAICLTALPSKTELFEIKRRTGKRNQRDWSTDHCHATGQVRGILCGNCNRALGGLKDNREVARRAIAYLDRFAVCDHLVCRVGPAGVCSLRATTLT